ncbi:MAG: hypothetical protein ACO1OQ_10390 [Rufibacter sp.]
MKVAFTLVLGAALGWLNTQWDQEGQLALVQHQLKIEREAIFKATVEKVEEKLQLPEKMLQWL